MIFLTTTFTIHTLFQMLKYFSKYGFDFAEIFAIVKKTPLCHWDHWVTLRGVKNVVNNLLISRIFCHCFVHDSNLFGLKFYGKKNFCEEFQGFKDISWQLNKNLTDSVVSISMVSLTSLSHTTLLESDSAVSLTPQSFMWHCGVRAVILSWPLATFIRDSQSIISIWG